MDGAAILRIFDGVRKHIEQHLVESQLVAHDSRITDRRHIHFEIEVLRVNIRLGDIRERPDDFGQVFCTFRKEHLARFDTAHVQNIIDKRKQMVRTLRQFFQIIQHQFLVVDMRHGQFRKAHNRIHRRTDIMTHVREERCLCAVGRLRHRKRILQHRLVHTGHANLFVLIGKTDDKRILAFIDRNNLAFAKMIDAIYKFKTGNTTLLEKRLDILDQKPWAHFLDAFRRKNLFGKEFDRLCVSQGIQTLAKRLFKTAMQLVYCHLVGFQIAIEDTRVIRRQKSRHSGILIHALSAVDFVFDETRHQFQHGKTLLRFLRVVQNHKAITVLVRNDSRDADTSHIANRQQAIKPRPNARLVILRIQIDRVPFTDRFQPRINNFERDALKLRLFRLHPFSAPFVRATEIFPVLVGFQNVSTVCIVKRSQLRKQFLNGVLGTLFRIEDVDTVPDGGILFLLFRNVVHNHHRLVFVQYLVFRDIADKAAIMPANLRRIEPASVFRNGIALLELLNKRLGRKVLNKRIPVFRI